ncbi:Holliday junction branch migration protein RuvA [Coprococcus eutactus]|jgi:Holliday junction DNA helicase RuvA|uniref:Holliday junction branch migration complex subunit RuvA n=1 Tax=Coprococcus ammoniilyticus TaxID=2981785 RepID=A0ABV1EFC0_9FIRM|nr:MULTISPECIES: Holliday junction branch migration protein RuvA [Clostridia]MDD6464870.1 Holliday junction branch migration protein RuvA [Coprococcus sp.]MCB5503632.1 Holliday junction branch migration protein RuvA [Coprococcus eutactus]NSC95456.1 Holliday junction branch migration protein RuvA [Coprococcus eutactus]NSD34528.1 Holliday junction branch migration protein RuvA [Coprococcus eutactus]NSE52089.1 Holliday junction branch migration protein RuvA [Coprococcus eutactus]
MIAYISGALVSAGENYIVIDNHGMGYRIFVSGKFLEHIPAYGTQIKIYTHMYIREDELTLYGFHSEEELSVFRILIGISGVGPKVAMAILTALTIQELQLAVISEDAKTISKANGVGAKGASRIILELKDKLKMEDMMDAAYEQSIVQDTQDLNAARDAILALVNLGYSNSEAALAVKKIGDTSQMDIESILKAALKKLI